MQQCSATRAEQQLPWILNLTLSTGQHFNCHSKKKQSNKNLMKSLISRKNWVQIAKFPKSKNFSEEIKKKCQGKKIAKLSKNTNCAKNSKKNKEAQKRVSPSCCGGTLLPLEKSLNSQKMRHKKNTNIKR